MLGRGLDTLTRIRLHDGTTADAVDGELITTALSTSMKSSCLDLQIRKALQINILISEGI